MKKINFKNVVFFVFIASSIFLFGKCKTKTSFENSPIVSYKQDVSPIISSNCAFSGCHGEVNFIQYKLTSYEGLVNGGIVAGNPQKSELYQTIISLNDGVMPKKPYKSLTDKQIKLVFVWIGQGAKNN